MHPTIFAAALFALPFLSVVSSAQAPVRSNEGPRQVVFQTLEDSQWVRLAATGLGRREGQILERSDAGLLLSPASLPLRVPATSIDTLWTRGSSAKTGAIVGGIVGACLGVLAAYGTAETGETVGADFVIALGAGGAVGGGLLGALIGLAVPKWHRRYP